MDMTLTEKEEFMQEHLVVWVINVIFRINLIWYFEVCDFKYNFSITFFFSYNLA